MTGGSIVFQKFEKLKHVIKGYREVGVAYSGGVDSTLLLYAACEAIGPDRVVPLYGRSLLNYSEIDVEDTFTKLFKKRLALRIVDLNPLAIPEFISNSSKKCYYCKRKTYTTFLSLLRSEGVEVLLDGTNCDDLRDDRPGLQVVKELHVATPLVQAGIGKREIRLLARAFDLPNHDMPSNSCLATRLVHEAKIDQEGIARVEKIENFLKKMGFTGFRAKPMDEVLILEIAQHQFLKISSIHNRIDVLEFCKDLGFMKVLIDISGRQ